MKHAWHVFHIELDNAHRFGLVHGLAASETGTAWWIDAVECKGQACFERWAAPGGCLSYPFAGGQPLFVESSYSQGWLDCLQFVIVYLPRRKYDRHLPTSSNQISGFVRKLDSWHRQDSVAGGTPPHATKVGTTKVIITCSTTQHSIVRLTGGYHQG